jgi:hypothetical protein
MLRKAVPSDLLALKSVRSSVVENVVGDSTRVTDDEYNWFVANPGVAVWEENGDVVGFSAADPRNGNICALFWLPDSNEKGSARSYLQKPALASRLRGSDTHGSRPIQTPGRRNSIERQVGNISAKKMVSYFSSDHCKSSANSERKEKEPPVATEFGAICREP